MKVLVDTCVWSLALRRQSIQRHWEVGELDRLISHGLVIMIGPVRQELLSGIREPALFDKVSARLAAFADQEITTGDYVEAARTFNTCRSSGIQGSNTDFLICAVALRIGASIFTTDRDFSTFQRIVPIRLYTSESQR